MFNTIKVRAERSRPINIEQLIIEKKVTLNIQNKPAKYILSEIEKLTGLQFVMKDEANGASLNDLSIHVKEVTVESALNTLFAKTEYTYRIIDNIITIVKRSQQQQTKQQEKMTINGKVVEKNKNTPIPGATAIIVGTSLGAITDAKGDFQIQNAPVGGKLEVSFLGMKSVTLPVTANSAAMVVELEVATMEMEAVIVTGVFERKADSYTGAVTTIKKEELQRAGNTNILQSLKNIDPSFQVVVSNEFGSDPNRVPEIQMRGSSSFSDMKDKYQTSPNQPLFIVDGFEQTIQKVMDMDMNRVASVTLLKDATAKALYGSKGANGVVIIETLIPEKGRLKVSYMGNFNVYAPDLTSYNLANAREKLQIEKDAGVYNRPNPTPAQQQADDEMYNFYLSEIEKGVDTYWLNKPLRVSFGHKHSLNLEGGDDAVRYGIDFGYNSIPGVMKGSDRSIISGGFTFQYRYKDVVLRNQLSVAFNNSGDSPYGKFSDYAKMNPYWRTHDEDGSILEVMGNYNIANQQGKHPIYNPLINSEINTKNQSEYTDISNNFYVEWEAFKGMKLKGRFGLVSNKNSNELFLPRDHTSFRDISMDSEDFWKRGRYTMGNGKKFDYNADVSANYSRQMGKSLLFANAQWSMSERKSEMIYFQAVGYANNKMDYITNALSYGTGAPNGSEAMAREMSALFSMNYSYDNKYLLDATYRANASSLFGKNNRWGGFWSAGIGWNLHNEGFFKEVTFIEKLKLRASTGYTGSQNFNSYQAIATYKDYNESYDNIIGSHLVSLANPNLRWQKTMDNNFGVELSFLERFDVTFDYYIKNTDNLLTPVSLPPSVGFSSFTENIGTSKNEGFEAKVNYRMIKDSKRSIYLSVYGSVMHNKNKITKISDALTTLNNIKDKDLTTGTNIPDHEKGKDNVTKPATRYQEGQSLDAIWAVPSLGINPMNGKEIFLANDGTMTYSWNPKNQVVVGDKLPKYSGTFGLNFEYKGVSLNASFFYRLGGQYYNQTLADKVENADIQYNVDKRMFTDRWTTPGVAAKYKRYSGSSPFSQPTSRFVQDINELELTSLNIGYDFRACKFIKKSPFERLKLLFYMNDVFRISTIETERGTEYPFARTFSFSVQATF